MLKFVDAENKQMLGILDLTPEFLDEKQINDIRASVQTGTPLGNDRFKAEVERL